TAEVLGEVEAVPLALVVRLQVLLERVGQGDVPVAVEREGRAVGLHVAGRELARAERLEADERIERARLVPGRQRSRSERRPADVEQLEQDETDVAKV